MISLRPDRLALSVALAVLLPASAGAQALSCRIPDSIPVPAPRVAEPARIVPTARYSLSLSWSPQYCRGKERSASFQCGSAARFGFVLHGLWPEGKDDLWPQYCRPASAVPPRVVRDMLCISPSADLIQNEWARHGTCGWSDPAAYFATGRRLFQALRFPDMAALSRRRDLTAGVFRDAFVRLNERVPGLTVKGIVVDVNGDGWLQEVRLCLDRTMAHAACPVGAKMGAPAGQKVKIWRGNG